MKKTQVQIPDELFYQAKTLSKEMEVSFADLVRRGLEYVVAVHRHSKKDKTGKWFPPQIEASRFNELSDTMDLREVLELDIIS